MFNQFECIYLKPGEMYYADEPLVINTVLGSCVSITMYVRRLQAGIMCHCMLPASNDGIKLSEEYMKYVDCALTVMQQKMQNIGADRKETEVKLFGGSDMFSSGDPSNTIGTKNINAALEILKDMNYVLMAQDTGGPFTRKLYFSIDTGTVYLRKISRIQGL